MGVAQSALSKEGECSFLVEEKMGLCSSFFPYQPQGTDRRGANVSRLGGRASLEAIPIGGDKAKSRWFSMSRAFAPEGREKFLDFALYRRRSTAG